MRSCAVLRHGQGTFLGAIRASPLLLAAANRKPSGSKKRRSTRSASATSAASTAGTTLATFVPNIASTWMAAASNKMLQPHHVTPDSRKLVWWQCPSCHHQFNKRIDLHVAAGGACPKCHARPGASTSALSPTSSKKGTSASSPKRAANNNSPVAHRCRPDSSQATLAAENANRIKKSVADGSYLRQRDTRNLMPMLAKSFDKEAAKIAENEVIAVSPKLDGIRCVTAYDAKAKKILFFSRAGTLFECCDAKIEPYLQSLFECDPTLVLDGELYNDSANAMRMAELLAGKGAQGKGKKEAKASGKKASSGSGVASILSPTNRAMLSLFSEATARANPFLPENYFSFPAAPVKGSSAATRAASAEEEEVIGFDQLTSAIRATRERRTPQHEALQRKLQYHIFDLLYSKEYPSSADSPPFRLRYAHLAKLLTTAHETNAQRFTSGKPGKRDFLQGSRMGYDPRVLRLVPSVFTTKAYADNFLRAAMAVGYEGIMVRRDGLKPTDSLLTLPTSVSAAAAHDPAGVTAHVHRVQEVVQASVKEKKPEASIGGGYGYGQRSSTLLKYKVMQDAEFVIVSAVEGKGKWKGCLGAFVCQTSDKKKTFTVTPASTDEQKAAMWRNWQTQYKGKALTVQFQELTPDGIPRFPVGKAVRGAANGKDWI